MAREPRDGIFGNDRPTQQPEDYQPPTRPRAGENNLPGPVDEEVDGDDGHDEVDPIAS